MAKGVIEKIKCDKCGYENEPQRIFCHECGAKLDRSEYVHEVEEARAREARDAPKRVNDLKKRIPLITPRAIMIYVLGPFLVALVIQMLSPMDPAPGPVTDDDKGAAMDIGPVYGTAFMEGSPKQVSATEKVLSVHLQSRWKKPERGKYWEKTLMSGWIFFQPNEFTVVTARDLAGMKLPVYFSATYGVVDRPEGDTIVLKDFYVGRLKLPGAVAQSFAPQMFADAADQLNLKPDYLARIQDLNIREGVATLTVK